MHIPSEQVERLECDQSVALEFGKKQLVLVSIQGAFLCMYVGRYARYEHLPTGT